MSDLSLYHTFMIDLAREAGDYARDRLQHTANEINTKGEGIDVVTSVDIACEQRMIDRIRAEFPDHGITGEEHGQVANPDAGLQWLIDPLDGTNNYVMGLPLFGNCISLLDRGETVVATMHDSMRGMTYSAMKGRGAFANGEPVRIGSFPDIPRTTISWTQGYAIESNDIFVANTLFDLENRFKRVLRTWSPSIDWCLIAAGQVGAFVALKNQLHDLLGGELLVAEAGGDVWRDKAGDLVIAGAPGVVSEILDVMNLQR